MLCKSDTFYHLFSLRETLFSNNNFLSKQIFRAGKVEHWVGLEPTSLSVWLSAFTFRPPALLAPHCSLTLIQELLLCPIQDLDTAHAHCMLRVLWDANVHAHLVFWGDAHGHAHRWSITIYLIHFSFALYESNNNFLSKQIFRAGKVEH